MTRGPAGRNNKRHDERDNKRHNECRGASAPSALQPETRIETRTGYFVSIAPG
jgi:hypothetical protein